MRPVVLSICLVSTLIVLNTARASVPDLVPIGGVMTEQDGKPLNGPYDVTFSIYATAVGGLTLWQEDRINENRLQFENGLFSAYLGKVVPLDFFELLAQEELWLGIRIGQDAEMGRLRLGAAPFALEAQYCHEVVDAKCGDAEYLKGWDPDTGKSICAPVYYGDIDNVPADIADGDDDTKYSAGTGLNLSALEFSVDQPTIEHWAQGVCYDTQAELTAALDTVYVNEQQTASITNDMLAGDIAATKIAGTAWTSENDGEGSGLNADLLDGYSESDFATVDHHHDGDYADPYKQTILVSPVGDGTDTVANGDVLLSALSDITDASETNPYLIKIEPGIYKLADAEGEIEPLYMKAWVDIEGSGENVTKITSVGTTSSAGTVSFFGKELHSQLRSVTVVNTGGNNYSAALAILFDGADEHASIKYVTAESHTSSSSSWGILVEQSDGLHLSHFTAKAQCDVGKCFAVWISDTKATVSDADLSASQETGEQSNGLRTYGTSDVVIRDTSINLTCGEGSLYYGLRGVCAAQTDGSLQLERVDIAVHCEAADATALNVLGDIDARVANSTLKAAGGDHVSGISVEQLESPTGTKSIRVFNTTIISDGPVVKNEANRETHILGSSVMEGAATVNEGTLTCLNVYDESVQFYPDTCPE